MEGFRLRTHNQNMTFAAKQVAEKKTAGHLSLRVVTRLQSLSLPNMISIRLRRLYFRLWYLRVSVVVKRLLASKAA